MVGLGWGRVGQEGAEQGDAAAREEWCRFLVMHRRDLPPDARKQLPFRSKTRMVNETGFTHKSVASSQQVYEEIVHGRVLSVWRPGRGWVWIQYLQQDWTKGKANHGTHQQHTQQCSLQKTPFCGPHSQPAEPGFSC